uniref:3-deoxy-8-phosphooctulonate synthase n=2 Tax=Oryza TaxID=4527 RepID=A0A0E0BY32_9ORYZ
MDLDHIFHSSFYHYNFFFFLQSLQLILLLLLFGTAHKGETSPAQHDPAQPSTINLIVLADTATRSVAILSPLLLLLLHLLHIPLANLDSLLRSTSPEFTLVSGSAAAFLVFLVGIFSSWSECVGLGAAAAAAEAMDASSVALYGQLKAAQPFFLLAGPNVIESEEHVLKMAKHIKGITTKLGLPLVFKSSFDKANRTSSKSFRGPGLEEGLKILEKVKATYDLPVVTDVHESHQCEAVGRVADIIQIPAFLCRQTDLLVAAAKTGKIINIKKGQFCAPSVMVNSAEKIRLAGNQNVMVCERGTMFGYNDLIVDPRNFEWLREANCPVVADVTHALQQPAGKKLDGGGVASGGLRELIPCIARTSVAVGVDGIFMEVHDDPLNAPCDGPTQWPLRNLEELLEELIAIARVTKGKKPLKIDLTPFKE